MAFKSDGNGDLICYNRANTGDCNNGNPEKDFTELMKEVNESEYLKQKYNYNPIGFGVKKAGNEPCNNCNKKVKHCKCKIK